jgi:NAD(P)-dependent dehydrogenase (short-subunit alcohol dehydrogenase family)
MDRLRERVTIITGAAGQVGSAAARLFSREGAKLVISDLDADALAPVLAACDATRTIAVPSDNRDVASLQQLVKVSVEHFGALHVVLANAGIEGPMRPFLTIPIDAFDTLWTTNARGTAALLQAAIPRMIRSKGGSIVVTGSMASVMSMPGIAPYAMSKAALVGLVRTVALEFATHKIRANLIAPGGIEGRMLDSLIEQVGMQREDMLDRIPLRRFATCEEVAKLALFLASDESSYCTGAVIAADGGYLAG